jgi:hypothetical protein
MCTVSFIPSKHGIIITSNRDEKSLRQQALAPQIFEVNGRQLVYPVDAKSNGTWFIVNTMGTVGVLLNGAFEPHVVKSEYRMSRGTILPAIFATDNPVEALQKLNLQGIENCTLLLYHENELNEFRWDGESLFSRKLDTTHPHIYSSVTLYNEEMIQQRVIWFNEFLSQFPYPTQADAIHFHSTAEDENKEFGLQMNRNNEMLTVSVTSVCIHQNKARLLYKDCVHEREVIQEVNLEPSNEIAHA